VNTPNEQTGQGAPLVRVDPERRAIDLRIEHAKNRLIQDLNRASTLFKRAAGTASRTVQRILLVGGLLAVGLLVAFIRRRHRIRVTWK